MYKSVLYTKTLIYHSVFSFCHFKKKTSMWYKGTSVYFRPLPSWHQKLAIALTYGTPPFPAPQNPDLALPCRRASPTSARCVLCLFSLTHQAPATGASRFTPHLTLPFSGSLPCSLLRTLLALLVPYLSDLENSQLHEDYALTRLDMIVSSFDFLS